MTATKDQALKLLSRRGYAVAELKRKLLDKEHPYKDVMQTLEWLQEHRFLDDARFAAGRIRYRAEVSRWGRLKILQELKQKGVPEEITQEELNKFEAGLDQPLDPNLSPEKIRDDFDWQQEALTLLEKRFGHWPEDLQQRPPQGLEGEATANHFKAVEKEKARRINFLLRRGFTTQQALWAFGKQLDATR